MQSVEIYNMLTPTGKHIDISDENYKELKCTGKIRIIHPIELTPNTSMQYLSINCEFYEPVYKYDSQGKVIAGIQRIVTKSPQPL